MQSGNSRELGSVVRISSDLQLQHRTFNTLLARQLQKTVQIFHVCLWLNKDFIETTSSRIHCVIFTLRHALNIRPAVAPRD
jgi:hypothetical protein